MKAVVVNAGCANAVTGKEGLDAAKRVRARAAELLRCSDDEVFLASTGVIGVVLPDKKVRDALPDAVTRLSAGGIDALSHAILTTDVGPKVAQATFTLGGKRGRIVGVAKGAGMIHPNMATMLGFVMTDAALAPAALQTRAEDRRRSELQRDLRRRRHLDERHRAAAGVRESSATTRRADIADFQRALDAVCRDLAWMIVRDGEGATRVMELEVRGATQRARREARRARRSPRRRS